MAFLTQSCVSPDFTNLLKFNSLYYQSSFNWNYKHCCVLNIFSTQPEISKPISYLPLRGRDRLQTKGYTL